MDSLGIGLRKLPQDIPPSNPAKASLVKGIAIFAILIVLIIVIYILVTNRKVKTKCFNDNQCKSNEFCLAGYCKYGSRNECISNNECRGNEICMSGNCVEI